MGAALGTGLACFTWNKFVGRWPTPGRIETSLDLEFPTDNLAAAAPRSGAARDQVRVGIEVPRPSAMGGRIRSDGLSESSRSTPLQP